jgi:hypothetical protein
MRPTKQQPIFLAGARRAVAHFDAGLAGTLIRANLTQ